MNDPIYILFRHALDDDIYLEYMEDPREYWSIQRVVRKILRQKLWRMQPFFLRQKPEKEFWED